jgi:23S rRNA pseudouridine2605 synthase
MTEDGLLKPKSVRVIEQLPNKTWLEFRLNEGKNREIRKICDAVDLTVDKLRRVAIEGLNIQGLPPGQYMFTTRKELQKALGLNDDGTKFTKRSFISAKKTLNVTKVAKIVSKTARPADDRKFHTFRKENYYETVQSMKEVKARNVEEEAMKVADAAAQENAARYARTMKRPAKTRSNYGNKG